MVCIHGPVKKRAGQIEQDVLGTLLLSFLWGFMVVGNTSPKEVSGWWLASSHREALAQCNCRIWSRGVSRASFQSVCYATPLFHIYYKEMPLGLGREKKRGPTSRDPPRPRPPRPHRRHLPAPPPHLAHPTAAKSSKSIARSRCSGLDPAPPHSSPSWRPSLHATLLPPVPSHLSSFSCPCRNRAHSTELHSPGEV